MDRLRRPNENPAVDETLIYRTDRHRDPHQKQAARQRQTEYSQPWLPVLPVQQLPANHQSEYVKQTSPGAFTGLQQIAQYRLSFAPLQQPRRNLHQWPLDARHNALMDRFVTHAAPRLTRVTAS